MAAVTADGGMQRPIRAVALKAVLREVNYNLAVRVKVAAEEAAVLNPDIQSINIHLEMCGGRRLRVGITKHHK